MGYKGKKREREGSNNNGGEEEEEPKTSTTTMKKKEQLLPSMIKNKQKRSEIHSKLKREKKLEKRKKHKARDAADKRAIELGEEVKSSFFFSFESLELELKFEFVKFDFSYLVQLPPRPVPKTIENTREADETVCKPDDEEV